MKCTLCQQEIILVPSADERAKRYGHPASYYRSLFTTHSRCLIDKRAKDTADLIERLNKRR